MFYLEFLKQAIDPADHVTRSFVEHMIPTMMEQYAVKSAKGGDHSRDTNLDERTRHKFEKKDDQSMVSHQLNGIFPTMRLLNLLEAEGIGPIPFSEVERRVYILSYLMHDVDKIVQIHGIETKDREAIEQAKDLVAEQLRLCNVEMFFPNFAAYLEDITYLVVNTQQKWGQICTPFSGVSSCQRDDYCYYGGSVPILTISPTLSLHLLRSCRKRRRGH